MKFVIALVALATAFMTPNRAHATPVELTSKVFVEKRSVSTDGKEQVQLLPAERVIPGDKLKFVIRYRNAGDAAAGDFVITNPIPASVTYLGAEGSFAPVVSVDGGATFGELSTRVVKEPSGTERPARADEVTHAKWQFAEKLPAGASGEVAFRAELK